MAWPIFGVIVIEGRSRVAKILHILFCKIFIAAHIAWINPANAVDAVAKS